jgi:dienelactone hydrolase
MLSYIHNNKKLVILLHEIYGINAHIENVAKNFVTQSYDVICPNLLSSNMVFLYEEEKVAYSNFIDTCSFEQCASQIDRLLKEMVHKYEFIAIVGFSVGATVAWLCSANPLCHAVVGFYGSRIRNYTGIEPTCETLLFFPTEEHSFDVSELLHSLNQKEKVQVKQVNGHHGFADVYAPNYDNCSAKLAYNKMIEFLLGFRNTSIM